MIVSKISKLRFTPDPNWKDEVHFIELYTLRNKLIYRIELKGKDLNMENPKHNTGYRFRGEFDYLKVHRCIDPLINCFNVQAYCPNCGEHIWKLSAKLPLLIKIKTDFHVTKDTSRG